MSRPNWEFARWTLQRASQQWSTYLVFSLFHLAIVTILVLCHKADDWQLAPTAGVIPTTLGRTIFTVLHYVNPFLVGIYCLNAFSISIATYRTRGDAGLIQMVWHSPLSFFVGALTLPTWKVSTILLSQIPYVVLMWTLGGVTTQQIFASYFALLALLIFVAGLATFFSVRSAGSSNAGGASGFLALLLFATPYIIMAGHFVLKAIKFVTAKSPLDQFLTELKVQLLPFSVFHVIPQISSISAPWHTIVPFAIVYVASGLMLFGLAFRFMDGHFHSDDNIATKAGVLKKRKTAPVRRRWKKLLLSRANHSIPVAWREYHFEMAGWNGVFTSLLVVLAYFFFTFVFYISTTGNWAWWKVQEFVGFTVVLFSVISVVIPGLCAKGSWRREKQNQTAITLCLTPIPMSTLMRHKLLAAVPCVIPLALTACFTFLLLDDWPSPGFCATAYFMIYGIAILVSISNYWALFGTRGGWANAVLWLLAWMSFIGLMDMGDRSFRRFSYSHLVVHLWGLGIGIFVFLFVAYIRRKTVRRMEIWITQDDPPSLFSS